MASARGCFKNGCLGCLGFIILILLILGVTALLAKNDAKNSTPVDEVLAPMAVEENALAQGRNGKVFLNLAQGEFRLFPAEPGEGLRVEAVYDDELYNLEQEFVSLPDSSWQYNLEFQRVGSGLRAMLQSIFSEGPSAEIDIYLPVDVPIELFAEVSKGGFEGQLGGMWISKADITVHQGGFALEIDEPMKEPMESFKITSRMGGFGAEDLGNASPKFLEVDCSMGGAGVDLSGAWQNNCDVRLSVKMGGMGVSIPSHLKVIRGAEEYDSMAETNPEVFEPVLRIRSRAKFGEIEIDH